MVEKLSDVWTRCLDKLAKGNDAWARFREYNKIARDAQAESAQYIQEILKEFHTVLKTKYDVNASVDLITEKERIVGVRVTYHDDTGPKDLEFRVKD